MRSRRTVQNTWVDVWKLLSIEVCNYHNYHHDLILTSTAICHKHGRENPTCTSRDARLLWMKKNTENNMTREARPTLIDLWMASTDSSGQQHFFFVGDWPQQPNDQTTNRWYLRDAQQAKPSTSCLCHTRRLASVEGVVERQKFDLFHPIVLKKILKPRKPP